MNDAAKTLSDLVALYGWRFSSLDAQRAGVPEQVLFDAVRAGKAKIEHTSIVTTLSTYLVFA